MTDELHHYCSLEVAVSILEKREFWLSSLTHSNDAQEGRVLPDYWLSRFDQKCAKQRAKRMGCRELIRSEYLHNFSLGLCFSEERDLLSQWRGYAANGAGCSITFDVGKLRDLRLEPTPANMLLEKVSYNLTEQAQPKSHFKTMFEAFGDDGDQFQLKADGSGRMHLENSTEKIEKRLEAYRRFFTVKSEAFHEEKEWRLLVAASRQSLDRDIRFRTNPGNLIPYMPVQFPKDAIKGITIGPTSKVTNDLVADMLRSFGFSSRVWVRSSSAKGAYQI